MIVLDTNVISELSTATPNHNVKTWFDRQDDISLFLSAMTIAELRLGVELLPEGKKKQSLWGILEQTVIRPFAYRTLAFTSAVADFWPSLMAREQRRGNTLSTADAIIAATALACGAKLATRDSQLLKVKGLPTLNPWALEQDLAN